MNLITINITNQEVKERLVSTLKHSFNYNLCSKIYNSHKTIEAVKELISFISLNIEVVKQVDNKVLSLRDLATFEYIKYLNITGEKIDETGVPANYIKIVKQTTTSALEMTPQSINEPEMSSDEILSASDLLAPVNEALQYWHQFLSGEVT